MTAEQLEELLIDAYLPGYKNRFRELQSLAPTLARRVIAAEKLVEALDAMLGRHTLYCGGEGLPFAGHTDVKIFDIAERALTAYRESSK